MADVSLQIVNGKCNLSDAQIKGLVSEADQIHGQALKVVDKTIRTLPNEPTDQAQAKLVQQMQALLAVGVVADGLHVVRGLCSRLATGLKTPGIGSGLQLPGVSSEALSQLRKAIE